MVFQHKKSVMYLLAALQGGFAFAEIRAIEDESIPKGFENYQAISTMNVPVYINGRIVATTMVKFDDATIEIINPVSVINRVPTLSDANKQKVLEVLSQKLPNHSERLCKLDAPKSVGYGNICQALTPEIAGVIFNPSNLNLYVFINPKFLESTNGPINPMLASSTSSFSYFNNSSLLYSTTDFNDSSLNLNTNQYFNYGNASLLVTPALEQTVSQRSDNDTTLSINNLTLRYYWNPALISAGTTITAGDNILAQQNIIGMSMRNNNEVYSYSTSNSGTPVEVLLTTNSQVRVYKDNQLIYAQQLPAGKQKLDTYSFPDGSYNITIEVIDQFNKKTVLREFFTKFSLIPEVDKPNYQFALGYLQKTINSNEHFYYPQSYTDEPVFNAKWTQSLNNRLALTGNMLSNFDDIYATFGLDSLFGGNLRLSWYNTVSNVNKYASAITGSWNFGNISWYSNILGVIDNNDSLMPKPQLFNPLPSGQQLQLQNNLSFTWLGVSTSLSHSWNTITHQNRYGVSLSRNLFSTSGLSADMTFSAVKTDHDHLIQAGIRFYFTQGRWNVSASTDYMDDGQTQGKFNQSASVYYSHYSSPNAYLSSNATLNYSEDNSSGFVSINGANKLAQYNVQSNITKDTTQVSAMVNSSMAFAENDYAFGYDGAYNSGVVASVYAEGKAVEYDIYDNDLKIGQGQGTGNLFLMPSYKNHNLTIVPKSSESYQYDQLAKKLVLYPGNIQKVEWHLARVVPFMSHIVIDHDGELQPLAHAILKQNDEIVGVTSDDGFIQADILSTSTELAFEKGDQTCHIQLPTMGKDDLYIWQSQTVCK